MERSFYNTPEDMREESATEITEDTEKKIRLAALLLCGCPVDVGDALAQVEVSLTLGNNAVHLDQGGVVVLVSLATLVLHAAATITAVEQMN